jgi:hypothetical protein
MSVLSLATTPADANLSPVNDLAIDRVDSIREKLLRHDRESNSEEKIKLAQWPNWPNWPNWSNWRNWQNFPNYWRNY